jgi:two-component system, NarL family, nitrate/nitrite response regulator NarP
LNKEFPLWQFRSLAVRTVQNAERTVSVIVGDSNPLMLSALSEVFERDVRFSLLATTATAEGFLTIAMRISAQVGIIDWNLPAGGGAWLIERLREEQHGPRIIVYSDPASEAHLGALGAGAAGFVARSDPVDTLLETCVSVAQGKMVFPYLDIRALQKNPLRSLSRRETELLEALSRGLTNRQLSSELQISPNTVKFHLSNLYDKLSVTSRAQAIAFYYSSRTGGKSTGGSKQ